MLCLPEEAARWEAPTAFTWMSLHPWEQQIGKERLDFRKVARGYFDVSVPESPQLSDDQHLHILTTTLSRFLWSIKELQASPLMDAGPEYWPLVEHKRTLLDKLDHFLACPYSAGEDKDEEAVAHTVVRSFIIHLCHLYAAGDLMDWLPVLLHRAGRDEACRARMDRWARESPSRVRDVAFHSAQILSMGRDFVWNSPTQSFYIFYAGAALWCSASLLSASGWCDQRQEGVQGSVLRLNEPGLDRLRDLAPVRQWIQNGGNVRVGTYGIPDLGNVDSPRQVLEETIRVLRSMRIWKLSDAFSNIMRNLMLSESRGA